MWADSALRARGCSGPGGIMFWVGGRWQRSGGDAPQGYGLAALPAPWGMLRGMRAASAAPCSPRRAASLYFCVCMYMHIYLFFLAKAKQTQPCL